MINEFGLDGIHHTDMLTTRSVMHNGEQQERGHQQVPPLFYALFYSMRLYFADVVFVAMAFAA